MPKDDVKNIVIGYIRNRFMIGRSMDTMTESDSLLEKGILDSTGMLELVGFLEETFGVKVEDDELIPENLDSMSNIVAFVLRKKEIATL